MESLAVKLRLLMFVLVPYAAAIWAWGWGWIFWLSVILLLCHVFPDDYRPLLKKVVVAVVAMNAIHTLALAGLASVPGATALGGWLFPLVYIILCFLAI